MTMQQLTAGTLLQGGKYKIEKVLGQGGFGITYLANQSVTIEGPLGQINADIKVCIKEFFMKDLCNREKDSTIVSIPSTGSKELVEKFQQKFMKEALNISKLHHPNIIKVTDVFEENGTAYYVMEYIDGGSLSDIIREKGKLEEKTVRQLTGYIADALHYIHSQNMNHLDIKPGNMLLRKDGGIVLIDFGLSKNYDVAGEQTTSTPIGISVGYAPLEQSRIGGVGTFSPPTDIYSLGATMYKMLTGETPPEASEVMDEGLPTMPFGVSEVMKVVIEKAMEPRRKDRYQTIDEMMEALSEGQHDEKDNTPNNVDDENTMLLYQENTDSQENPTSCITEASANNKESDQSNREIPRFLREEENEATRMISIDMVIQSSISTDDVVDLGLSVNWCGYNLGAKTPSEDGKYMAWCDKQYAWRDCPENITHTDIDVATSSSDGRFRIPTRREFKELLDRCRWSWIEYKGEKGCKVTGPSGKSIFLPASGKMGMNGINKKNSYGYYWTSNKASQWGMIHYLYFNEEMTELMYEPMNVLRSIRPVCDK